MFFGIDILKLKSQVDHLSKYLMLDIQLGEGCLFDVLFIGRNGQFQKVISHFSDFSGQQIFLMFWKLFQHDVVVYNHVPDFLFNQKVF